MLLDFLLVIGIMLLMLGYVVYEFRKAKDFAQRCELSVGCAGTFEKGIPEKYDIGMLVHCLDNEGGELDEKKYMKIIIRGSSMSLCGIDDGNIVAAEKVTSINASELPQVLVLERTAQKGEARYKLRRAWKCCNVDWDNAMWWEPVLKGIIASEEFQSVKNTEMYDGDDVILADFRDKRLERFLSSHTDHRKMEVIISTTLHTDEKKIRFSIHPMDELRGKVKYVYDIKQCEDVSGFSE